MEESEGRGEKERERERERRENRFKKFVQRERQKEIEWSFKEDVEGESFFFFKEES